MSRKLTCNGNQKLPSPLGASAPTEREILRSDDLSVGFPLHRRGSFQLTWGQISHKPKRVWRLFVTVARNWHSTQVRNCRWSTAWPVCSQWGFHVPDRMVRQCVRVSLHVFLHKKRLQLMRRANKERNSVHVLATYYFCIINKFAVLCCDAKHFMYKNEETSWCTWHYQKKKNSSPFK